MLVESDVKREIARLQVERQMYRAANLASNTRKSYADSWKRFESWCLSIGAEALPANAETVALWATSMLVEGRRIATVELRISGVANAHTQAGFQSPIGCETRAVLQGARRLRHENARHKRALTVPQLWKICRTTDTNSLKDVRDRALIVLGFAGAFRRSELAGLDLADVSFVPKGLLIHLKWSKTDQEGHGRDVPVFRGHCVDTCPVRALSLWIERRGSHPGRLFLRVERCGILTDTPLGPGGIAQAIKCAVGRIGLDPHQYAGHSLRAGHVTAGLENGAQEYAIMRITGHRSVEMLHRYVRPDQVFSIRNPLAGKL